MEINKQELQDALEKVKPGLANKELIEQTTSFAFIEDRVTTYNDEISISHPVSNLNVTGAIKAQALYAFLNKVNRDKINVECEEKQVVIKAGKAKAGLVLEQKVTLPIEEVGKISKWQELSEDFIEALKICYTCCSKDMSRPILTCVHVSDEILEASDSYQIISYQLSSKVPIKKFLLPSGAAKELIKYNVTKIASGQGWVHFKTEEGTIFSSRVLTDSFPDTSKFLEFDGVEFDFPAKTIQAMERAEIFSKSDFNTGDIPIVSIKIAEGQVEISAKNEYGWFEESLRAKYEGDPIEFVVGIDVLFNLFSKVQACTIGDDRIKFEGDKWVHVVAMVAGEGGK